MCGSHHPPHLCLRLHQHTNARPPHDASQFIAGSVTEFKEGVRFGPMNNKKNSRSFSTTLIATLSGFAAIITAIATIYTLYVGGYIPPTLTPTPTIAENAEDNGGFNDTEEFVISGRYGEIKVSRDKPVKLNVSGFENTVYVSNNTIITEIVLSGRYNVIYIPKNSTPKITLSCSSFECKIIQY